METVFHYQHTISDRIGGFMSPFKFLLSSCFPPSFPPCRQRLSSPLSPSYSFPLFVLSFRLFLNYIYTYLLLPSFFFLSLCSSNLTLYLYTKQWVTYLCTEIARRRVGITIITKEKCYTGTSSIISLTDCFMSGMGHSIIRNWIISFIYSTHLYISVQPKFYRVWL